MTSKIKLDELLKDSQAALGAAQTFQALLMKYEKNFESPTAFVEYVTVFAKLVDGVSELLHAEVAKNEIKLPQGNYN